MKRFGRLQIKSKLLYIILMTTSIAVVLACGAIMAFNWFETRRDLLNKVQSLAEIVGSNSVAALDFNDPETAESTLAALSAEPQIVHATIYDRDDVPLAHYRRGEASFAPVQPQNSGYAFGSEALVLFHRVSYRGVEGTVYLRADLYQMYARLYRNVAIVGVFVLVSIFIAYGVAARLQRLISVPVLELADAARYVSAQRDYTIKVEKKSEDELGYLIDGFNDMLGQIQRRDNDLLEAHGQLEQRAKELHTELSERKRAEEAVRQRDARYRSLIENASDIILVVDPVGQVLYSSPSIKAVLGYATDTLSSMSYFDLVDSEDASAVRAAHKRAMTAGSERFEFRMQHRDGRARTVHAVFNDQLDQPAVGGIVLNIQDISERKEAEAHLNEAQRMESIGQLAAGIAHEINTPLQFVGDNTYFIQQSFAGIQAVLERYAALEEACRSTGQQADALEAVAAERAGQGLDVVLDEIPDALDDTREGVQRVRKIVQAMKSLSHPGTTDREQVDLNQIIENSITISRNEWKYVADLKLDLDESLPAIPCLANELGQVIINLVVNAAHAIAEIVGDGSDGKGTIEIRSLHDGDWATILVRDTGGGIPPEARARVFEPFFTTKEVGKGTGQGLAIAHRVIVSQLGGKLGFETRTGTGTTFRIDLPINTAAHLDSGVAA